MTEATLELTGPAQKPAPPPKIRMDKSRSYGTVHGVRSPGDPHFGCHFYQDGLYFDAQGFLVLDHFEYNEDSPEAEQKRKTLAKKIERHLRESSRKQAAATAEGGPDMPRGIDDIDEDDEESREPEELEPINLSDWARGQQQVEWNDITQAIAQRFKKRIASIADAIPFLVAEGVVPRDQVAKKYKRYLD